jgi:hypothetical protein
MRSGTDGGTRQDLHELSRSVAWRYTCFLRAVIGDDL